MSKEVDIRLRLVNIKQDKILLTYYSQGKYYAYVGGKLEYGETIEQGAQREVREECGEGTTLTFEKILYVRDYIDPAVGIHSVELFIKGDVNKFEELERRVDPSSNGRNWTTWKDIFNLPPNLYPKKLSPKLVKDYRNNFPNQGEYVGNIGTT